MIDDYFEGIPRARKAYLSGDWNECLAIQEENHRAMEAQWHEERVKPQAVTPTPETGTTRGFNDGNRDE